MAIFKNNLFHMKKSILLLAAAVLVVSCDVPQGGNKRVLKKTADVVSYDDPNAPHGTYEPTNDTVKVEAAHHVVADTVKAHSTEAAH